MTLRMLVDATHTEETRVVLVRGSRLEEFDFESSTKQQLKGNIYLAKVTRVEPSLQAAFVEYGGNRHGFLAFNEIHPDYYQIPVADRQALLAEEAQQAAREAALEDEAAAVNAPAAGDGADGEGDAEDDSSAVTEATPSADAMDELPRPRPRPRRSYKIQEVIKKRQILLVQVVKEERGNKGAALTTYLSLAGRYCVLMPNTARGGGISRKITNQTARRKLKQITAELDVSDGMGLIVRTAGMNRTKSEIRRDYEYLLRIWDQVRELTLNSTAPCLVYEEANLIKRVLRDLYTKDIDEILVEGEDGYRSAKEAMRMMLPSHAKKVQHYRGRVPLFHRYQVEQQLDSMHSNVVQLKSGGYIVINATEALVAIDVNSGRSTKEHNIEETALKTNLEASDEVARQLRLRDLAGLIVIDFIDMEENRHNRAVERRLRDALKSDRARIQTGRISGFGLLEMSRQRLRPSFFEASTVPCPHCHGSGFVRSTESTALHVLRAIEEEGIRERAVQTSVQVPTAVALYLLNQKRQAIATIEQRYGMKVVVDGDDELIPPNYRIEVEEMPAADGAVGVEATRSEATTRGEAPVEPAGEPHAADEDGEGGKRRRRRRRRRARPEAEQAGGETPALELAEAGDAGEPAVDEPEADSVEADSVEAAADATVAGADGEQHEDETEAGRSRKRRRGRRGGRRRRQTEGEDAPAMAADQAEQALDDAGEAEAPGPEAPAEAALWPTGVHDAGVHEEADDATGAANDAADAESPHAPEWTWGDEEAADQAAAAPEAGGGEPEPHDRPGNGRALDVTIENEDLPVTRDVATDEATPAETDEATDEASEPEEERPNVPAEPREPRRGWWQRRFFS